MAQAQYISELESEKKFLLEQLHLLKKARFASKSERAVYLNQLSLDNLFDEVEVFSDPKREEPTLEDVIQVPAHTRKKKSVKEQLPEDIPVVERHHYVDEGGRTRLSPLFFRYGRDWHGNEKHTGYGALQSV